MTNEAAGLPPVRHSLGRRFLLVLAGIFLLTFLSVAGTVFGSIRNHLASAIQANLGQTANDRLEKLQAEFARQLIDVQAWASLEVMNDIITGDIDGRIRRTLAELKKQYGLPGHIYAFDDKGKLVASSRQEEEPEAADMPPAWQVDSPEAFFVDKHDNPLTKGSGVAFGRVIHASFNPALRLGTLVIAYPWSAIEQELENRSTLLLLLSPQTSQALFVARELPPLDGATIPTLFGAQEEISLGGQTFLAGAADSAGKRAVAGLNWTLLALTEKQQALEPIREAAVQMLLLGLAIAVPITLLILWLTRRLVRPITSLTSAVAHITASSDLSQRVKVDSDDELGVLSEAFNAMTAKLQASLQALAQLNRTLEQKVADRTEKLQATNDELQSTIEQLKSAQTQLVQQEKMASLGQLVAGVAHELNNPIGSIYANLPILDEYVRDLIALVEHIQQLPLSEEHKRALQDKLDEIDFDFVRKDAGNLVASGKNAANRVKEIVGSLRNFSRLDEAELKDVLLEDGLDSTLALLHHQTKNRIEIVRHYSLNRPVSCYAGQINQVFMNLLGNAIQAIEGAGTITLDTALEGENAVVKVRDSGSGISQENLNKIFDPFFTTKKIGEGTGLGLSITYGIIEKHHGAIAWTAPSAKAPVSPLPYP
ncbi:sensor histidine kinase [Methylogaea oryzae]|uniref:sensor histidine kinase n=1 Tax=Methylogaea oryzae TaxID=1295382 RepID=UPI0006D05209|nr:ATP-binding protein [Methylogaea oryzae]